jgi:DNA polymerase IIIc chi subunit
MTGTASTEFGFYHLTRSGLDGALPRLLEKAHAQGKRVLLRCPDAERLDQLDRLLWTYRNDSSCRTAAPRTAMANASRSG